MLYEIEQAFVLSDIMFLRMVAEVSYRRLKGEGGGIPYKKFPRPSPQNNFSEVSTFSLPPVWL
jgi:hypothetical protein